VLTMMKKKGAVRLEGMDWFFLFGGDLNINFYKQFIQYGDNFIN